MKLLPAWLRPWNTGGLTTRERRIEDMLMRGDVILLDLAPGLAVRVTMDGLALIHIHELEMGDEKGRQLLMNARLSATYPHRRPTSPPPAPEVDEDGRLAIPVQLTAKGNQRVGDVMAAYFRLKGQPTA